MGTLLSCIAKCQLPRRSVAEIFLGLKRKTSCFRGGKRIPLTVKMGDFLKSKFEFLFNYRYDVNGDGVVNLEDYEAVVEKLGNAAGVGAGDPFYEETKKYQKETFQFLMDHADADHDGAIDVGEFSKWAIGVAAEIAASGSIPQHLQGFFKASFSNSDQNGDGEIDRDEFIALQKLWDIPEDKAGMGFDKLTNNGAIKINEDSWMELSKKFMTTNDPADPSRYYFGMH